MKVYFPILVMILLGTSIASAQNSVSTEAGTAAQTQTSVEASKSGHQSSVNGSSSNSASSSASSNVGPNSVDLASGTKIDATLDNSLDAKKNKPGDRVEARTTQDVKQDGKIVLRKGTSLVGHVTEAQTHTKEQAQSELGIMFDHAVLKSGQEIPLHASIQALAAAQSSTTDAVGSDEAFGSAGAQGAAAGSARGGVLGGVSSTGRTTGGLVNTAASATGNAEGTVNAVSHTTGAVGGLTSTGQLASNSSGVFGLQGLSINSAASNATQGSMIVSPTRNVHLDSGTQMLLNVNSQTH